LPILVAVLNPPKGILRRSTRNSSRLRRFCAALYSVALLSIGSIGYAQQEPQPNLGAFYPGERLQYKVKWLFFRLGTIIITTDTIPGDMGRFKVSLTLDSNPDVFLISIHSKYEGIVGLHPVRCESFRGFEKRGDDTLVTTYTFNDSLKRVVMEQRLMPIDTVVKSQVTDTIDRFFDGASLFFYARTMAHTNAKYSAPTLVEMEMFTTDITFSGSSTAINIGAVDEDIDTRKLFGKANFEGKTFGGFSGEFRGWFSNDYASIPIKAEMSISLGTVTVELEQWSRPFWFPPRVITKR